MWKFEPIPGVYDADYIFGFGPPSSETLPAAADGDFILKYGGWSLKDLAESIPTRLVLHPSDYDRDCPWLETVYPSGIYRLATIISAAEKPGWEPAPTVLTLAALVAHRLVTGEMQPGPRGNLRCAEETAGEPYSLRWLSRLLRHTRCGRCQGRQPFMAVYKPLDG